MKKTKINLLQSREDFQKAEAVFFWIRISGLILTGGFFIIFGYFFLNISSQDKIVNRLLVEKESLLKSLQARSQSEGQFLHLQKKYQYLKEFLKDDARFLPYYNLLNSALSSSTPSANLTSFKINKDREVDFTVLFLDFDQLLNFFKFVEQEEFLSRFEKISLRGFNADFDKSAKKDRFELSFSGRFITIKNENL